MKLWIVLGIVLVLIVTVICITAQFSDGPNYKIQLETKMTFDPEDEPVQTPGAV